jgi:hypothetical protein
MSKATGRIRERPPVRPTSPASRSRVLAGSNQARIGLLFLAACIITTAGTRCESKPFWTMGEGSESCGEFIRATEGEKKARPASAPPRYTYTMRYAGFEAYADGFLTGTNMGGLSEFGRSTRPPNRPEMGASPTAPTASHDSAHRRLPIAPGPLRWDRAILRLLLAGNKRLFPGIDQMLPQPVQCDHIAVQWVSPAILFHPEHHPRMIGALIQP